MTEREGHYRNKHKLNESYDLHNSIACKSGSESAERCCQILIT